MDATLSRFTHQQAIEQRKQEVAAALALAAAERPIKQEQTHDPDFNPIKLEAGQNGDAEAEGNATGAAQLAEHMSQVSLECVTRAAMLLCVLTLNSPLIASPAD